MKKFLVVICSVVLALALLVVSARLRSARAKPQLFRPEGNNNRRPSDFGKAAARRPFCFGRSFTRMSAIGTKRTRAIALHMYAFGG